MSEALPSPLKSIPTVNRLNFQYLNRTSCFSYVHLQPLEATGLGEKRRCPQTERNKGNLKLCKKLSGWELSWEGYSKVSREVQVLYQRCKASFKACLSNWIFLCHPQMQLIDFNRPHVCSRVYNKRARIVPKRSSKDSTHFRKHCKVSFFPFHLGSKHLWKPFQNQEKKLQTFSHHIR